MNILNLFLQISLKTQYFICLYTTVFYMHHKRLYEYLYSFFENNKMSWSYVVKLLFKFKLKSYLTVYVQRITSFV